MSGTITHANVGTALDSTEWAATTTHLIGGVASVSVLILDDIEDTPISGHTANPISSNWAYVHASTTDPHTVYVKESTFAARGDILVGSGAGTFGVLALGASGYVLTAAATETLGMKWSSVSASGMTEGYSTGASILSGTTSISIAHGLGATPNYITITPIEQGDNDYGRIWVGAINSTAFIVYVDTNPGASNLDFMWYARAIS